MQWFILYLKTLSWLSISAQYMLLLCKQRHFLGNNMWSRKEEETILGAIPYGGEGDGSNLN